jgi:hypothetical protein
VYRVTPGYTGWDFYFNAGGLMKLLYILLISSSLYASNPSPNPTRRTLDVLTITMQHDSPTNISSPPPEEQRPPNPMDKSPEFTHVRLSHQCCNTKIKLALITGGVTITAAGLSALATYYAATGSCK